VSARAAATTTIAALVFVIAGVGIVSTSLAATPRLNLLTIESEFMCTSCHEPLELVQSPQAVSEKQYIELLIAKGDSKQQIVNAMVAAYGVTVLAKPPASGFNLAIYILPPAILVGGIVFLMVTLPKWRARSRAAAATPLSGAPPLSPAESERLDDDLAHLI
jgi:cytochrome c-type biogenesis protein CcmH